MKRPVFFSLALALVISLSAGCAKTGSGAETPSGQTVSESAEASSDAEASSETDSFQTDTEMFTEGDLRTEYDEEDCIRIQLEETSATASSDSVQISGSVITITEEAAYMISGTLDDGMIIVNADENAKIRLVFNGAEINSETSAALYILEADKVFVTLAEGTENVLSNGGSFEQIDENNIDGAVFSRQDLTINGSGALTVTSPAGHGIVSKDDLVITGGTCMIASASHGLQANDSVRITGAALTIDAGKDGIHCENDDDASLGFIYISGGAADIEAEGDGISAGAYIRITDGEFQILSGGGSENGSKSHSGSYGGFMGDRKQEEPSSGADDESSTSMKGLKASADIQIEGGTFAVNAADDGIHSNSSVTISGGVFEIATGDDGIHADETLTITSCDMTISESYEGLEAKELYISGGDIVINASDDGINASGGADASGMTGGRDGMMGAWECLPPRTAILRYRAET